MPESCFNNYPKLYRLSISLRDKYHGNPRPYLDVITITVKKGLAHKLHDQYIKLDILTHIDWLRLLVLQMHDSLSPD